jgi:hypothetical protein
VLIAVQKMNAAVFYETLLCVCQTAGHHTPYHRNLDIHSPVNLKSKEARNSLSIGKTTVFSGSLRHDSQDLNPVSEHVCVAKSYMVTAISTVR